MFSITLDRCEIKENQEVFLGCICVAGVVYCKSCWGCAA